MLNRIRGMIIAYRFERKDWRFKHAQEDCLINVVAGLLADARAIDEHADSAEDDATRLALQVTKLTDDLAEAKRPFSAQMEMQNRRIIALTAELDRLKNDSGISDYVSK